MDRLSVFFDFDCTITSAHWHWFTNDMNEFMKINRSHRDIPRNIMEATRTCAIGFMLGDHEGECQESDEAYKKMIVDIFFTNQAHLEKLKDTLSLLSSTSAQLYIASRGNPRAIRYLVKLVGLDEFFPDNHIYGSGAGPLFGLASKQEFMRFIMSKTPNNKVYYIDDDSREFYECSLHSKMMCINESIGLTKNNNGLTNAMLDKLVDIILTDVGLPDD